MRKLLIKTALLVLGIGIFISTPTLSHANEIRIVFDNTTQLASQHPIIVEGRTLVPWRLFQMIAINVVWCQNEQTATLTTIAGSQAVISINSYVLVAGSEEIVIDVPAQIIDGRIMMPLRAIMESLGYYVGWNEATSTVFIGSTPAGIQGMRNVDYITIRGMQFCTSLNHLDLRGQQLQNEDIASLHYMVNLDTLFLDFNHISDISALDGLPYLRVLYLGNNQINDITPLANLRNLELLELWDNQIKDITPLSALTNLIILDLGSNPINDFTPLASLTNLDELKLWHTQLSDITPLSSLTNLTILNLNTNQITDIAPLSYLTQLEELCLAGNQVSDVTPLPGLTQLVKLDLRNNQIRNIMPLAGLRHLEELRLNGNPIPRANLAEFEELYSDSSPIVSW